MAVVGRDDADAWRRFERYVARATDYERQRVRGRVRFDLVTMRALMDALGHPERHLVVAHVAGSNGKGSVCTLLDAILRAAGWRTGLYLSPHVLELGERLTALGRPATRAEIGACFAAVEPALDSLPAPPSFFELLTAMALLRFANLELDAAIVEVGLGGRLDATNVVHPAATAITSIEREHTRLLGDDLATIAREKAGILCPHVPLCLGPLPDEARRAVLDRARQLDVPLREPVRARNIRLAPDATLADLVTPARRLDDVRIGLHGRAAAHAAALAVALADTLAQHRNRPLPEAAIRTGLATARLRGRFERLAGTPPTVLDVAHTPRSLRNLLETAAHALDPGPLAVVFGALEDKPLEAMLATLAPRTAHLFTAPCPSPRSADPAHLAALARQIGIATTACTSPAEALARARTLAATRDAPRAVLATGSVYLVGALLEDATSSSCLEPRPDAAAP